MTHFVSIAKENTEKDGPRLVAIFKGVVIHIAVHDEGQLMKASSRFRKAALNQYGHVPKDQAWKAVNAFVAAQIAIKSGEKKYEDFPDVQSFPHVWRFELT